MTTEYHDPLWISAYRQQGLCVFPATRKLKRPTAKNWVRTPKEWDEQGVDYTAAFYQTAAQHGNDAVCCVTGLCRRGILAVVDFDQKGRRFTDWFTACAFPSTMPSYIVQTPSGGYHAYFWLPKEAPLTELTNEKWAFDFVLSEDGSIKQATLPDGTPSSTASGAPIPATGVTIETRGQGGQVMCPPSEGYRMVAGNPATIPAVTIEQWRYIKAVGQSFNNAEAEKSLLGATGRVADTRKPAGPPRAHDPGCTKPGTWLIETPEGLRALADRFTDRGWRVSFTGKRRFAVAHAATEKEASGNVDQERAAFYGFSPNMPLFTPQRGYSLIETYAILLLGTADTRRFGNGFSLAADHIRTRYPAYTRWAETKRARFSR